MPIRPPSPPGTASAMVCTVVTARPSEVDSLPTLRIFLLSRSVTRADPSGRNAMPHGTARFLASTVVTTSVGGAAVELADGSGEGDNRGGWPCSSGGGGPKLQAARAVVSR